MSTIDPPNSGQYNATALMASGGMVPGKPIEATALAALADNSNICFMNYRGPLGHCVWGTGVRSGIWASATGGEDMLAWYLPGSRIQRAYLLTVYARHTDAGESDGTLTIRRAGVDDLGTITVTAGQSLTKHELTIDSPTASDMTLLLQNDSFYTEITSAAIVRKRTIASDSIADLPRGGGFRFSRSDNLSSTEPLRDEWVNRMINNPRYIWKEEPHSLACINTPIRQRTWVNDIDTWDNCVGGTLAFGTPGADGDGNQNPIAVFPFSPRYAQTVRIYSYFVAPTGTTMRVMLGQTSTTMAISGTAPAAMGTLPTWRTADLDVEPGSHMARIYFDGTRSGDAEDFGYLFAFQIMGLPS